MDKLSLRRLFLVLLIVVSFFFTYLIFTQENFSVAEEEAATSTSSPTNNISLGNRANSVFGPSRIIKYAEDDIEMINPYLIENNEAVESFGGLDYGEPEYFTNVNIQEIIGLAASQPSYIYSYDQSVAYGIFNSIFSSFPEELSNMTFDYVVFPLFQGEAYFYNSRSQDTYVVSYEGDLDDVIQGWVDEYDLPLIPVDENVLGNKVFYLPEEQRVVAHKSYLLNRLPNSLFVDILFDNPEDVNVRSSEEGVRYNDYYSELFISSETNSVVYNREQYNDSGQEIQTLIEEGYDVMSRLENWPDGVHLSDVDYENQRIFFRRYLDGLPLFAENYEDGITIEFSGETLIGLSVNMNIAQIPIDPADGVIEKTLPNGETVINIILSEVQDPSAVENIRIGYEWLYNEETRRVAQFVPYWFYRYEGTWHKIESLPSDN